jgi:hypothetical protein
MAVILSTLDVKDVIFGREKLIDAVTDKKWRDMDDKVFFTIQLRYKEVSNKPVAIEITHLHSPHG